jgi:outer membrane protein assembly factor BamA
VRKYQPLFGSHGIAVRLAAEVLTGDVPFFAMAEIGGANLLRGIYAGRFRDRTMLAIEAEYRFPIVWRFGGVVFGGFGEVAPSAAALVHQRPHPAAGAGIRFSIDGDERVNARLDAGFSEDDWGIYFMVGEAF